jgi:hypothetical protein
MKVARLLALCTGCHYLLEDTPVLISVRGRVNPRAIVWPEGLSQKIPMTPLGIEPQARDVPFLIVLPSCPRAATECWHLSDMFH